MTETITLESQYDNYRDYPRNTPEVATWRGRQYVGVRVSLRGFANEYEIYVVDVTDITGLAVLVSMHDRAYRGASEAYGYNARWLSADETRAKVADGFAWRGAETDFGDTLDIYRIVDELAVESSPS